MSLKTLGKDSLIYGFGHVVSRLITFLLLPIYTHTFSAEEYGVISLAYAFIGFTLVIYRYGMDTALMKFSIQVADTEKKSYISSIYLYEIVRASKEENRVYIDLNVTNKQLWPFDFAAFTLISVKDENNKLGQIDPYKGKNTVKYGIENEESVGVELVYNFESSPKEVNIICKSTMAISADSVFFKQNF